MAFYTNIWGYYGSREGHSEASPNSLRSLTEHGTSTLRRSHLRSFAELSSDTSPKSPPKLRRTQLRYFAEVTSEASPNPAPILRRSHLRSFAELAPKLRRSVPRSFVELSFELTIAACDHSHAHFLCLRLRAAILI